VGAVLKRCGMNKLGRLALEPAQQYVRERPGELVHVDVKKLGRIQGGARKRVATGSSSTTTRAAPTRPAFAARRWALNACTSRSTTPRVWPTPKCSPRDRRDGGPLEPAAAFFARHAINVKLPTDKGPAYVWVARDRVPFARRSPSTDSPAPTPHQRQGLCLKTTGRRSWRRGSPRSDSGEGTPEIEIPEPFWLRELFS
jgi:hypothetical protein